MTPSIIFFPILTSPVIKWRINEVWKNSLYLYYLKSIKNYRFKKYTFNQYSHFIGYIQENYGIIIKI
jgi:hypothetical protein